MIFADFRLSHFNLSSLASPSINSTFLSLHTYLLHFSLFAPYLTLLDSFVIQIKLLFFHHLISFFPQNRTLFKYFYVKNRFNSYLNWLFKRKLALSWWFLTLIQSSDLRKLEAMIHQRQMIPLEDFNTKDQLLTISSGKLKR